jgi:hypothetical protein
MPIYENVQLPFSIAPGETATTIVPADNVQGALPFKSERVALVRGVNTTPQRLSAELQFSALRARIPGRSKRRIRISTRTTPSRGQSPRHCRGLNWRTWLQTSRAFAWLP